jgi:hypothetical protein
MYEISKGFSKWKISRKVYRSIQVGSLFEKVFSFCSSRWSLLAHDLKYGFRILDLPMDYGVPQCYGFLLGTGSEDTPKPWVSSRTSMDIQDYGFLGLRLHCCCGPGLNERRTRGFEWKRSYAPPTLIVVMDPINLTISINRLRVSIAVYHLFRFPHFPHGFQSVGCVYINTEAFRTATQPTNPTMKFITVLLPFLAAVLANVRPNNRAYIIL